MAFLNVNSIRECTEVEGPGKRFAVWVQGCARNCPGCCNPHMQAFEKKHIVDVKDLFALIRESRVKNGIEGVSFLGGEPILQAAGYAELAELCKKENLSVLVFTGFLYQELKDMKSSDVDKLLLNTDMLIDGAFVQEEYETERDWIGSRNQKVYFLSDFYKSGIEYAHKTHKIEIRVENDFIKINGWPF